MHCLTAQTSKESLRCPLCKPARGEAGGAEAEVVVWWWPRRPPEEEEAEINLPLTHDLDAPTTPHLFLAF